MEFEITLTPGDLPVEELQLEFPDDGNPGNAQVVVAGDARARSLEEGITLTLSGTTYGPFRGLGDYDYDPQQNATTLYLGEQLPQTEQAPSVSGGTVGAILLELYPEIDLTALPLTLQQAQVDTSVISAQSRREYVEALIGGLGFRLIEEAGTYTVAAPATADLAADFKPMSEKAKGDLNGVPRRIIVTGGNVSALPVNTGAIGPLVTASVAGDKVTLNWRDPVAETVARVRGYIVQHFANQSWEDLATVQVSGADSYSYTHTTTNPGVHIYRIVPLVETGELGAVALRRGYPGPEISASTQAGTQAPVTLTEGATQATAGLPGEAPDTRVTATGPNGTASAVGKGNITIGLGKTIDLRLIPGNTYTLTYADPNTGARTYPDQTFTVQEVAKMNPVANPAGKGAVITWDGDAEGRFVMAVEGPTGKVYEGVVAGLQVTVTGLALDAGYQVSLYPEGAPELVETVDFRTLDEDLEFSPEELWAMSKEGTFTQKTPVAGGETIVTRTRKNGQLTQVHTLTKVTVPLTRTNAETGVQTTTQESVTSETTTVYEFGFSEFRDVETGSSTLTVNTAPSGKTRIQTRVAKTWHPKGWLNIITTSKEVFESAGGGAEKLTGRQTQTDTWTRNGVTGWSLTRKRTGVVLSPVAGSDGKIIEWREIPDSEEVTTANAQPPETVPVGDEGAEGSLTLPEPAPPPVWENPPAVAAPEETPEGAQITGDVMTVQISTSRATPGFGGELTVDLPWTTDKGLIEWAAEFLLATAGRRQITWNRTYGAFWSVKRGGAVQGLRLNITGSDFTQEVVTRFAEV